ncbi:MAG: hypothetical protein PSU93_14930 [Methylobacter sp.]|uniref:Uncharacterized protein n=1 Tax=Candidatus Methylobacter titanis TaxID=3053457 RepID=A0AA43Q6C7_9GAMM|nr:hypothetical protein [Candidatus Methylobacter titanis]
MPKGHYSDCSLHSLPAEFPMPCDCGGFKDGTQSSTWWNHSDYTPIVKLRNFYLLWQTRIFWKDETASSFPVFLLTIAKHSRLARYFGYNRQDEAQQRADDYYNKS